MTIRNTSQSYGSVARFFHWLIGLGIIGLLIVGFYMEGLADSPDKFQLYYIHKITGIAILAFVALRIFWTLTNTKPGYPDSMPRSQQCIAKMGHWALYLGMVVMPLAGWVMSCAAGKTPEIFGIQLALPIEQSKETAKLANQIHGYTAWFLVVIISLHTLVALKHHFINKDNILRRMLPKFLGGNA